MDTASMRVRLGGQEIVADGSRPMVIGRDAAADIPATNPSVSRRHAVLSFDPYDGWVLQDVSKNGVFHEGHRVERFVVDRSVTLALGDPVTGEPVAFVLDGRAADTSAGTRKRPGGAASIGGRQPSSVYRAPSGVLRIGRAADNDLVLRDV